MLLVSNHLQKYMDLPKNAVIRINSAWVSDVPALEKIIRQNKDRKIYLDYPQGRTKTPRPVLLLQDAVDVAKKYNNVAYFAVSNIECPKEIISIQKLLPKRIEFVPKIESLAGVINLRAIIKETGIKYIMLDKEDLAKDLDHHNHTFDKCVDEVRKICKSHHVTLLELVGVAFAKKE